MADPTRACFDPNPSVFGLGVSSYLSNRTSGIHWSSVDTAILLYSCNPRCCDARQVVLFATAFSWNRRRKPRRPAKTGDLERRYKPGCHYTGLAFYSRYPNHRGTTQSIPCVYDHKLALSLEHIVSILSVQPYVLCPHLHLGLTKWYLANPVVRRRSLFLISLILLAVFTLYVGLNARTFGSQPDCNNTVKIVWLPRQTTASFAWFKGFGIAIFAIYITVAVIHWVQLIFFRNRASHSSSGKFRWHGFVVLV